ncbi:branched-chain amino acid ABC transporter permease [Tepidanaerobacter syntrophicus]|uniref:branched-chain amino acid ABC transporter permease n=1 Tax=Tepidanaerobacter syntrophicus TaxID=224999 RepID=UPI0017665F8E|nr:branched-chain amino acid ABC transporter permease [Tepidanaerobacter syntrophicus]GLI50479.1 branched-chain amino acid ABC transporter permease [Tepidanaerobacter syntrophicus]HHV82621.1 branched-chain amino acid ABC transporter permease [Tepidanaerobacter syntrophicus]
MFIQQLVNGISVGGIYALMATGYALIYSLLGFSNWAHGDVAMIGAYIAIQSVLLANMPLPFAVIIGVAGAGFFSFLNEKVAYKRIRDNNSPTMFLMIAAMGLSIIYQNAALNIFGSKFKIFPGLSATSFNMGNATLGLLDVISLAVSLASLVILDITINHTKLGLGIRTVASNPYTASLMGINIDRYFSIVFLVAGMYAGCAGILLGMKYTVYPTMGNVALKAFIASVLGGLGSVRGAIVGALIIGIMEVMVTAYLSSGLRDLFTFVLLIVILLVKPSGLMGVQVEDKA